MWYNDSKERMPGDHWNSALDNLETERGSDLHVLDSFGQNLAKTLKGSIGMPRMQRECNIKTTHTRSYPSGGIQVDFACYGNKKLLVIKARATGFLNVT